MLLSPPGEPAVLFRKREPNGCLEGEGSLAESSLSASVLSLSRISAPLRTNHGEPSSRPNRLFAAVVGDVTPAENGLGSTDSRRRVPGRPEEGDVRLYGFPPDCEKDDFRPLAPASGVPSCFCGGGFIGELTSAWKSYRER